MKIVFFSDIHGNQYAYNSFLDSMNIIAPDLVIFGGDIFGYYYGQEEIISDLKNRGYVCLLGNHDKMFLDCLDGKLSQDYLVDRYGNSYREIEKKISNDNVDFIRNLQSQYILKKDGLKMYFAHGAMSDPINGRIYPDTDVTQNEEYRGFDFAFLGHTHHQMIKQTFGCRIINPGSLGQQRDGKGCKYLIFDTNSREYMFKIIEYDRDALVKEIVRNDNGIMREKLIEVLFRKC